MSQLEQYNGRSEAIYELLYRLGATANYTGFFYAAYAVELALGDPQRLSLATKWLYPDVAKYYHTTWKAVERNIRTLIDALWRQGSLDSLWGRKMERTPPPAPVLSMLVSKMALRDT